jgi:hypothetical protein
MLRARAASLIVVVVLSAATAYVAAAEGGTSAAPRIRITFSGAATGKLADVERWIFLENGECYLRRMRDQQVQISWSETWSGTVGKALRVGPVSAGGQVAGTEVRDTCDEDELPPDPPENWLQSLTCSDPLALAGAGGASWAGTKKRPVLQIQGPSLALAREAVCTAIPRTQELFAGIPLARATIDRLRIDASLVFRLGSSVTRFGDYTPHANCQHNAKPYDGYRSEDACADELTWSGTVRITRLR